MPAERLISPITLEVVTALLTVYLKDVSIGYDDIDCGIREERCRDIGDLASRPLLVIRYDGVVPRARCFPYPARKPLLRLVCKRSVLCRDRLGGFGWRNAGGHLLFDSRSKFFGRSVLKAKARRC